MYYSNRNVFISIKYSPQGKDFRPGVLYAPLGGQDTRE